MVYVRLYNLLETEADGGVFEMWPPIDGLVVTLSDCETMFCGFLLWVLLDIFWWRLWDDCITEVYGGVSDDVTCKRFDGDCQL